eukprot:2433104-Amphidinium_carterae.1
MELLRSEEARMENLAVPASVIHQPWNKCTTAMSKQATAPGLIQNSAVALPASEDASQPLQYVGTI